MSGQQLDEERIFHVARTMEDPDIRAEYFRQVCAGDQALRERVVALLQVHEHEQDFLKSSPEPAPTVDHTSLTERPGTTIGRYKLMEQIGEGGMGTVFVAEQERPIRRKVAFKVIKPGMDSKAVVARFEAERQALAMMDHPNIAKVLDAGTTESGRPYFAMELVKGIPITEYCDKNKLTIRERLDLFIQACQAIQHAHQKGIIHRDIKPSNVLVTLHDGKPVPKVIDFGVAKALNARLTDKTIYTEHLQIVGTLLYMSPEQAELSGLDVDTRSDVYSLGVLLYELLTGTTPFQKAELDQAGFDEQRRIIRETDPPRASQRISSLGETATAVAEHRKTDPKKLHQLVRGDLDWIVVKALEKDRIRRYASAVGLSEDVVRYLNSEPIVARPPSASYRFAKFAVRNKLMLAMAITTGMVLAAGLAGATWFASREARVNQRLDATVEKLIEALVRQIVTAAMSGNREQAKVIISEAQGAGASVSLCENLRGLALVYSGEPIRATKTVEGVLEENPTDLSALCVKWLSALYGGNYGQLSGCMEKIRAQKPSIDDSLELLLFAQVNLYLYPNDAADCLEDLASDYPHWPVLQALYAAALIQQASDGPGDDETRGEFERALSVLEAANTLTPSNRFVRTEYLQALTRAIEFARELELADEEQKWIEVADRLAQEINAEAGSAQWSRGVRAYYLANIHHEEHDSLRVELIAGSTALRHQWQATEYWIKKDAPALQGLTLDFEDPLIDISAAYLDVETAPNAEKKAVAQDRCQRLFSDTGSNSAWTYSHSAVGLPLFAGNLESARRQARRVLEKPNVFVSRWSRKCLLYFADPSPENERRLLHEAGPYSANHSYAHHAVAMVAFARGERRKARRYFQSVYDAGRLDWGFYLSAFVMLERMEDQTWPSWIEQTD